MRRTTPPEAAGLCAGRAGLRDDRATAGRDDGRFRFARRMLVAALALFTGVALACGGDAARDDASLASAIPERIIVLAPNLTEIVFGLGLGDRVVGVGKYGDHPPEVRKLPRLGGLLDPHMETIVELRPDLVVLLPSQQDVADRLRDLGFEALVVASEDTLEDVFGAVRRIAERCGVPEAGAALVGRLRRELAPRPLAGAPRVLVVVGRSAGALGGLTVAGTGTFYDQLLNRLGAINVATGSGMRYPRFDLETVVRAAPQVIVELQGTGLSAGDERALIDDWSALDSLPAVRHRCVEVIEGDFAFVPGPRLPRIYDALRDAIASCVETRKAA